MKKIIFVFISVIICVLIFTGCVISPEDIAQTYLFLASHASDFITGQVISPNGGCLI